MSAVVGIDLGTTNTVVAAVQGGRAMTLANELNERLIPSVVSFHPNGSVIVGRTAKERRLQDAANTIYSTKRLIGRSFGSEEVQKAKARSAFGLQEGPGHSVLVTARGESYTLSEISAFVLREAKRIAENALQEPVERAVITVPANFNDLQRAATKVCGHIAGVEVLRILNEPTAAALAYGYGRSNAERIAVYDFGGGTFDVTLLDLAGNVFEVLATAGDTFLGGDDIDLAIAERMADKFLATHRYDPTVDRQVFERLLSSAEELKVALSAREAATVVLREVAFGAGGRSLDLPFTMTRAELEEVTAPFVDRTLSVCQEALSIARLQPSSFDQVIIVGGSTRIPIVRRRVAEFFGRTPLGHLSPDEVVAIGAAIQATALTGIERKRGMTVPGVGLGPELTPSKVTAPGAGVSMPSVAPTAPGLGPVPAAVVAVANSTPSRPPEPLSLEKQGTPAVRPPSSPPAPPRLPTQPVIRADEPETLRRAMVVPDLAPPGPRVLDEDPTEIRRATQALRPAGNTQRLPSVSPLGVETTPVMPLGAPPQAPKPPEPRTAPERLSAPPIAAAAGALVSMGAAVASAQSHPALGPSPWLGPQPPAPESNAPPMGNDAMPKSGMTSRPPAVPLLLDVTPLGLTVETVGGYCDVIIERNTPVPCERTRLFATAADNQTVVRVNVAQGESHRFSENVLLGQLELTGLHPAQRGQVQIAVTFEIDSDGILDVRAADTSTGKATRAQIRLRGAVPNETQLEAMRARVQRFG